jgi:glutamate racemase
MIGVFDSGIGGLTVLGALRRRLPHRNFTYVADTAHLPYGNKQPREVREYAFTVMDLLEGLGAEGIVIACGTASSTVLPDARLRYAIPVWGVVDASVEAATRSTAGGKIGVIATERTIASGVYQRKLAARGFSVWSQACPALVEAAEENNGEAELLARYYLRDMPRIDTLVLGCTHFALLRDAIERAAGPRIQVVDGAEQLARWIGDEVEDEGNGRVECIVTGRERGPTALLHAAARAYPPSLWRSRLAAPSLP